MPNLQATGGSLFMAVLVFCGCAFSAGAAALECGDWARYQDWSCAMVAPNYALYWFVDGKASTITFALDVQATHDSGALGWVGLGLSEGSGMPGSDIFLLKKDRNNSWGLSDMHSTLFGTPSMDASQDLELLSYTQTSSGGLQAAFKRPLAGCNEFDRSILPGIKIDMIYAFGATWPRQHESSDRGEMTLLLYPDPELPAPQPGSEPGGSRRFLLDPKKKNTKGPPPKGKQPPTTKPATTGSPTPDVRTMNVVMDDEPISSGDSFRCLDLELPSDQPYHITRFSGYLSTKGLQAGYQPVHHQVLFACETKPPGFGNGSFSCGGMPVECLKFMVLSVPGGGSNIFPETAGMRFGAGSTIYATLQMHYSNKEEVAGLLDSSGFSIQYTPQLRAHDIGTFITGDVMFRIPPLAQNWSAGTSVCPSACTAKFTSNITLVSSAVHMHKMGRGAKVQHYRGNQELRPIVDKEYYNFGFQSSVAVPMDTRVIQPGDTLATTCYYDNTLNNTVTFGEKTENEMCFSFNWYYPESAAAGLDSCFTLLGTPIKTTAVCGQITKLVGLFTGSNPPSNAISAFAVFAATGALIPTGPVSKDVIPFDQGAADNCPAAI